MDWITSCLLPRHTGVMKHEQPVSAPDASEYSPHHTAYVSLVPGADILHILGQQADALKTLLESLTDEQANQRYSPEKWSIKEVVGHITDAERIFAYRALRIARHDKTPLEGFEQDDYVRAGRFGQHALRDLLKEFECLRASNILLCSHFDQDTWSRRGVANGSGVTVRALAYIMAGHVLHHQRILAEKYSVTSEGQSRAKPSSITSRSPACMHKRTNATS